MPNSWFAGGARTTSTRGALYVDIDGFIAVRDNFGHDVADLAPRVVADQLIAVCRSKDVLARVGGDEFVVQLPSLHRIDVTHLVALKILERFVTPFASTTSP